MNASDSYGFVKHNLEIFGFGNDTQAMITSFLELLDNSIDGVLANKTVSAAVSHKQAGSPKCVHREVRDRHQSHPSLLQHKADRVEFDRGRLRHIHLPAPARRRSNPSLEQQVDTQAGRHGAHAQWQSHRH